MLSMYFIPGYKYDLQAVVEVKLLLLVHLSEFEGRFQAGHDWHVVVKQE